MRPLLHQFRVNWCFTPDTPMPLVKPSLICVTSLILSACVVQPTTVTEFDEQCQMETKSVILQMHEIGGIGMVQCSGNQDCKAALVGQAVGAALILPISAVISGTIALSSNSYYWLSEKAACHNQRNASKPQSAPASSDNAQP